MVYTASLSPTSYIPVPNVTLLRQYLTLLAFDRFHLLDIQLSISGAILTEYRYIELSVGTSNQGINDVECILSTRILNLYSEV